MLARTATLLPSASADPPAPARPGIGGGLIRSPRLIAPFLGTVGDLLLLTSFFDGFVLLSLAEKVASVLGCVVIVSMEDYRTAAGGDDSSSDVDAFDFDALACNLQVGAVSHQILRHMHSIKCRRNKKNNCTVFVEIARRTF